jgi:hypothetical protein
MNGTPLSPLLNYAATATLYANRFVNLGSDSTEAAKTCTAAADASKPIIGITARVNPSAINADYDDAAAAGDSVAVQTDGIAYLQVNGQSVPIAVGDAITATTAGVGVKSTTDGDWIGAIAEAAATTDGVKIPVRVLAPTRQFVGG